MASVRAVPYGHSATVPEVPEVDGGARDAVDPDRVKGSLVGLAVGDCLGVPVEGWALTTIQEMYARVTDYIFDPPVWTDDTQQALVLAESMVRLGRPDPEWVGRRFVEMAQAEGGGRFGLHRGYGSGFRRSVQAFAEHGDWRTSGQVDRAGSGAAMRIAPVATALSGWAPNEFRTAMAEVSMLTHREIRALLGGLAVAWVAARLAREPAYPLERGRDALVELIGWLDEAAEWLAGSYAEVVTNVDRRGEVSEVLRFVLDWWNEGPVQRLMSIEEAATARRGEYSWITDGFVLSSVMTAITLVLGSEDGFEETVLDAINLGGDADTVGAMVGGMAGAGCGYEAIPERWRSLAAQRELEAWADALGGTRDAQELPDLLEVERSLRVIVRSHQPGGAQPR
jgi:ADP-ribosyl-[dinitrogen reductase] hydrolase